MTAADASKGQFRHAGRYVAGYAGERESIRGSQMKEFAIEVRDTLVDVLSFFGQLLRAFAVIAIVFAIICSPIVLLAMFIVAKFGS